MYSKILSLRFPKKIVDEPIIMNLVKDFNLSFSILKATIYPRKEGFMVLELSGNRNDFQKGLRYLKNLGIKVESTGQDIKRDEEKCFHCGACTAVCPTGALHIKRPEMEVLFDKDKCSVCELCVPTCMAHAVSINFDKNLLA
jgi:L-aspartate semialdehyde sulfurtransferase ferredoxin